MLTWTIRDDFESSKEGFEADLSKLLGESWKIEYDPDAIYAYAEQGQAKNNFGRTLAG